MSVLIYTENGTFYLGSSKAKVIDSFDPNSRNMVRLQSPVYNKTGYIPFINEPGHYFPPYKSQVVYVESDGGYYDYPIAKGHVVTGEEGSIDLPTNFQREIPTCRGIYTAGTLGTDGTPVSLYGGHLLEFDDGEASFLDENAEPPTITPSTANKGVRLTTSGGNKIHIYEEVAEGSSRNDITIETNSGNKIVINDNDNTITVQTTGDAKAILDGDNNKIQLQGANIEIGDASLEALMKGDTFKTWIDNHILVTYNLHTHTFTGVGAGNAGVTLTPLPIEIVPPVGCYSTKHKVE